MALSHIISWKDISPALLIWNTMNILKNMDIQDTCMNSKMNNANMPVDVQKDEEKGLYYVQKEEKRLYFRKSTPARKIQKYYRALSMEQDRRSPHHYFNSVKEVTGRVFVDVGCAEGIHHWKLSKKPNMFICLSRTSNGWKPSELPSNHGRIKWRLSKSM